MRTVILSRNWQPNQPMDVQWATVPKMRITVNPSLAGMSPPMGFVPHYGPGGIERPMLERPYTDLWTITAMNMNRRGG